MLPGTPEENFHKSEALPGLPLTANDSEELSAKTDELLIPHRNL